MLADDVLTLKTLKLKHFVQKQIRFGYLCYTCVAVSTEGSVTCVTSRMYLMVDHSLL